LAPLGIKKGEDMIMKNYFAKFNFTFFKMSGRILFLCCLILINIILLISCAKDRTSSSEELNPEDCKMVVEKVGRLLTKYYVFPDVAEQCINHIESQLNNGVYEKAKRPIEFVRMLNKDLQSISKDKHLKVVVLFGMEHSVDEPFQLLDRLSHNHFLERGNFGWIRVEWLKGNIGYLDLRAFCPLDVSRKKIVAAMSLLSHMDAIIVDLRSEVMGGRPETVQYICSYFFDKPTLLETTYFRKDDITEEWWTLENVEGERMPDVPLYILTDKDVFSAGESFAYNLQALKRATVIGEITEGGAHITMPFRISDVFEAKIPWGRAINPTTGTNWEGVGVIPDIEVDPDDALDVALEKAREEANKRRKSREDKDASIAKNLRRKLIESKDLYIKGNKTKAISILNEVLNKGVKSGVLTEEIINDDIGYYFLNNDLMDMAIEAFKFNVAHFPKSYNTYHSLAEAYLKKGNNHLAIENLEKSLELNPWNTWATKMLNEINTEIENKREQ
jgi:hypothetical protein